MRKSERFDKIYYEYSNLVFQYAVVRVRNEDLAKELAQQTFVVFFENMDKVPDDIVKPWLLLCCKRLIIDYYRKCKRWGFTSSDYYVQDTSVVAEDNTEKVVEHVVLEQFTFRIMECLRQKNESWFQIIEAIGIFEMTQEEAAEYLGITVQVLRAKLYRARKFLRKKFGDEYTKI